MKKLSKKQKLIGFIAILIVAVIIAIVITTSIINNNNQIADEEYSATTINAGSNLIAKYIKKGEKIGGITGTLEVLNTADATATAEDIEWGKTAYVNGVKITGTRTPDNNYTFTDSYGNEVKVPGGFKVVNPEDNVTDGIIIEDVSAGDSNTKGSQFVWIPVGDVYTDEEHTEANKKTIKLGRYDFDTRTGEPSAYSGSHTEDTPENHNPDYGNAIALSIENFKTSVEENGGYYIARYEAGVTSETSFSTEDMENGDPPNDNWTAYDGDSNDIVIKSGEKVWNYVTQKKASELCINLKPSNGYTDVTSDLVNSYAWDTALLFIQECGTDSNYANQVGISTTPDNPSNLGEARLAQGNGATKADVQCNIYDMAGNCGEWTTETSSDSNEPCVYRGGYYYGSYVYTSSRISFGPIRANVGRSFRPLLYL